MNMKQVFAGFLFWIPILIMIFYIFATYDNIEINLFESYKEEYTDCQSETDHLRSIVENEKQVICECPKCSTGAYIMFLGFIFGVLACMYVILVGYPLIKEMLEERRKKKGGKK